MFIRKILQFDWLDCAVWRPSMHFRIDGPDRLYGLWLQLKHESFRKMGNIVLAEDREMLDMLGKLSANFQKNIKG